MPKQTPLIDPTREVRPFTGVDMMILVDTTTEFKDSSALMTTRRVGQMQSNDQLRLCIIIIVNGVKVVAARRNCPSLAIGFQYRLSKFP